MGVDLFYVEVHGCMFGVKDEKSGLLMNKIWTIGTTDETFATRMNVRCQGNHAHQWTREGDCTVKMIIQ